MDTTNDPPCEFSRHSCKGPRYKRLGPRLKELSIILTERWGKKSPDQCWALVCRVNYCRSLFRLLLCLALKGKSIIFLTWQTYFIQPWCLLLFTVGKRTRIHTHTHTRTPTHTQWTQWRLLWWLYEEQVTLSDEWLLIGKHRQDILSFSPQIKGDSIPLLIFSLSS